MIIGLGSDVVSIPRIQSVLDAHGERFLSRCFSDGEIAHVEKAAAGRVDVRAAGYAKRWAAKEACAKALGLGIRNGIFLKDIAVENDAQGKPGLRLTGGAARHLSQISPAGTTAQLQLSLSDEAPMAFAVVIVEARRN
jgi:holo-[acyl-carrier protein] synthase